MSDHHSNLALQKILKLIHLIQGWKDATRLTCANSKQTENIYLQSGHSKAVYIHANFEKAARIQVHWQEVDKNLPSTAPCLWPVRSYLGCAYPYAWRWQCECPFPLEQIWCCNGCHPDWQHHTTQRVLRGSSLRLSYQTDLYLPKEKCWTSRIWNYPQ